MSKKAKTKRKKRRRGGGEGEAAVGERENNKKSAWQKEYVKYHSEPRIPKQNPGKLTLRHEQTKKKGKSARKSFSTATQQGRRWHRGGDMDRGRGLACIKIFSI